MTMSDEEKGISAGTVMVSFLAGAALGAGLALLYAPKSGKEMRETITDLTEDAVDKIKEYAKDAQDKIKTAIEDGKETIVEKKSILASAIEAGREAMHREKERTSTP
jgi:gas vesicle protein